MHDILAKRLQDGQDTWDLHLNQVLAAIRFNVSEATENTPYYLLYGRDVVLPIDNLLKPRLKYQGEDLHKNCTAGTAQSIYAGTWTVEKTAA